MHYRFKCYPLIWSLILILSFPLLVASTQFQEFPVYLSSISPTTGLPGQKMELTLFGQGFDEANEVRLFIGELEILDLWVVSNEQMGAIIYIPENIRPGPRDVEVVAVYGPNEEFPASLAGGFNVLEAAVLPPDEIPPPELAYPDENTPIPELQEGSSNGDNTLLFVLVAGILLVGGVATVILSLLWRRSIVRKQRQSQASEQKPPQTCQAGTHYVYREKLKIKPGRWKVSGLKVTVYDSQGGTTEAVHQAPREIVKNLDKLAHQRLLHGMSEELEQEVRDNSATLAASILEWQMQSRSGQDIYLQTRLEGGQAEQRFVRYRCVGSPGGWQKQIEWTIKLKAVDHLPRAVRGPGESEAQQAYAAFLGKQSQAYVFDLLEQAGTLF